MGAARSHEQADDGAKRWKIFRWIRPQSCIAFVHRPFRWGRHRLNAFVCGASRWMWSKLCGAGVRSVFRGVCFAAIALLIGCLLVPTLRAKMTIVEQLFDSSNSLAASVSRHHAELELFYSQRPILAAGIDLAMFALWVFSLARFGPVKDRKRTDWLCPLAAITAALAVIASLFASQQRGPERGWQSFDALFLVAGVTIFIVYLLMALRESLAQRAKAKEPPSNDVFKSARPFVLRWSDMSPIAVFLALLKDGLFMALAIVFAVDAPDDLYKAIRDADSETVRRMLEKDPALANCRLKTFDAGLRPAHIAVIFGDEEILLQVLRGGAAPDGTDDRGRTPLAWAALTDLNGEMANMLLDRGAEKNLPDEEGQTPLILAICRGNLAVVGRLVERGALVNRADKRGRTALHYAAASNQVHLVRLLIAAGAIPSAEDTARQTPLALATATVMSPKSGEQVVVRPVDMPWKGVDEDANLRTASDLLLERALRGQLRSVAATHDRGDISLLLNLLGDSSGKQQ